MASWASAIPRPGSSKGSALVILANPFMVPRWQIVGCEQAVVSNTDFVHVREGWIAGGYSGDGAQIVTCFMLFLSVENLS